MRSVGLLLKVLWSPAEAMFLVSKNPRALVPIVFLALCSLAGGMLVMAKVPASELAMRAIERSPQGADLPSTISILFWWRPVRLPSAWRSAIAAAIGCPRLHLSRYCCSCRSD